MAPGGTTGRVVVDRDRRLAVYGRPDDAAGIGTRLERIDRLEGRDGRLSRIVFARGEAIQRDALFFNTSQGQRSALAAQLGCGFTRTGHVRCDRKGRTGVPNLFIAGDANGDVQFVIVAAAEGAAAAVAINKELQEDDHRAAGRAGCLA